MKMLIKAKAFINMEDKYGKNALIYSIENKNE